MLLKRAKNSLDAICMYQHKLSCCIPSRFAFTTTQIHSMGVTLSHRAQNRKHKYVNSLLFSSFGEGGQDVSRVHLTGATLDTLAWLAFNRKKHALIPTWVGE